MIKIEDIRNDLQQFITLFEGMAITVDIDGEIIDTAVMSQKETAQGGLIDEGFNNQFEKWIRFNYDDISNEPIPNESIATIDTVEYVITEVVVDSVKATMRCKLQEDGVDL